MLVVRVFVVCLQRCEEPIVCIFLGVSVYACDRLYVYVRVRAYILTSLPKEEVPPLSSCTGVCLLVFECKLLTKRVFSKKF